MKESGKAGETSLHLMSLLSIAVLLVAGKGSLYVNTRLFYYGLSYLKFLNSYSTGQHVICCSGDGGDDAGLTTVEGRP